MNKEDNADQNGKWWEIFFVKWIISLFKRMKSFFKSIFQKQGKKNADADEKKYYPNQNKIVINNNLYLGGHKVCHRSKNNQYNNIKNYNDSNYNNGNYKNSNYNNVNYKNSNYNNNNYHNNSHNDNNYNYNNHNNKFNTNNYNCDVITRIHINQRKKVKVIAKYKSYIELDMHGNDPLIKNSLDWVPIIRDLIYDSYENKVYSILFITGKGLHSKNGIPTLRPLVYLISKRLGFHCEIPNDNEGIVICKLTECKVEDIYDEELELERIFKINENDEQEEEEEEEEEYIELYDEMVYQKVQSHFKNLPSICAKIICVNKNLNEAIKYANNFEKSLLENDSKGYKHYLSTNLNKTDKKELYSIENSIGVFKVKNVIHTRRDDGGPKFFPFVKIKLLNANINDAKKIIHKVIFRDFGNSGYFGISIDFTQNSENCQIDDIIGILCENVTKNGFHVNINKDKYLDIFYFNILNDDYYSEDEGDNYGEEEEEEEEFMDEEEYNYSNN